MKAVYKQHGNVYAGFLQKRCPNLYLEGLWLNGGDWDVTCFFTNETETV
jgi:hypothetical protein